MDLIHQYINQCITTAAGHLRLSTEKSEVVALIRESISKAQDLESEIANMKKITEFSTFAIRLGEIYNYIAKTKVDFFKVTEKFKEHSYLLLKDMNTLLDKVGPKLFQELIVAMHKAKEQIEVSIVQNEGPEKNVLSDNYKEQILKPIEEINIFLKNLARNKVTKEEIKKYIGIMETNSSLSKQINCDVIALKHITFAKTLALINSDSISVTSELIGGMRAILIIIVVAVKGKEVDLTRYLSKAEKLANRIDNLK
ncbi:MAG: hypothetical protein WCJ01_05080 [Ignavibacteria bacterium]